MNFSAEWIDYECTNAFSALAIDYLQQHNSLGSFYQHTPDLSGIESAIRERAGFNTDRDTLVEVLNRQYAEINTSEKVKINIQRLAERNVFTICTAHQPNLFTGYLYFIYKIVHAIKIADELNNQYSDYHFVPVYYMGSEDNDLEELNHIFLNGEKLTWDTTQTGAVGRMKPKGLETVIERIGGELGVYQHGSSLIALLRQCYLESASMQEATFRFVNSLFGSYGLIVIIADDVLFKKKMLKVFEDDLFTQTPAALVAETARQLAEKYFAQVNPRDINLFYMKDDLRERIVQLEDGYEVHHTGIHFTREQLEEELKNHPERFSPNVVLRGLFQETILPNIVFIGGGSEVAYWLELKALFQYYKVPYPLLLQRNSFLVVESKAGQLMEKLELGTQDIFSNESAILNEIVRAKTHHQLTLEKEIEQLKKVYKTVESLAGAIDVTLTRHVNALEAKVLKPLHNLEKKMLRAEKRRFEIQRDQIQRLKSLLFPRNGLQERVENVLPYYARYGQSFIDLIYKHSPTFQKKFVVLKEELDNNL
ncbi:MAG: bacillithiol biosynthesis cysteine-adding enzyme BshC [Chitinophagaceae bacterium]|nr:bacillithiol biosynthesis cysteine-adding enzyme BshC [Chitinophagaceae bacterium]